MGEARDKFLTEKMGKCWHSTSPNHMLLRNNRVECDKCHVLIPIISGADFNPKNPDFSTWEGFGILWNWAKKSEKWGNDFLWQAHGMGKVRYNYSYIPTNLIDPETFATELAKFLGWKD